MCIFFILFVGLIKRTTKCIHARDLAKSPNMNCIYSSIQNLFHQNIFLDWTITLIKIANQKILNLCVGIEFKSSIRLSPDKCTQTPLRVVFRIFQVRNITIFVNCKCCNHNLLWKLWIGTRKMKIISMWRFDFKKGLKIEIENHKCTHLLWRTYTNTERSNR